MLIRFFTSFPFLQTMWAAGLMYMFIPQSEEQMQQMEQYVLFGVGVMVACVLKCLYQSTTYFS